MDGPSKSSESLLQKGRVPAERGSGEEDKIKGESRLSRERGEMHKRSRKYRQ